VRADLLISMVLDEAAEVGDDGVTLKHRVARRCWPSKAIRHEFDIIHPVHGKIGELEGYHDEKDGTFEVDYIHFRDHPKYKSQLERPSHPETYNPKGKDDYQGLSRTLIMAGLRDLMKKIPRLKKIVGPNRVTGTHHRARAMRGISSNTAINIPRRMRRAAGQEG